MKQQSPESFKSFLILVWAAIYSAILEFIKRVQVHGNMSVRVPKPEDRKKLPPKSVRVTDEL